MIKLITGPNSQWHSKIMTKIKYFLGILVIIFILVSANHYFPFDLSKKAAFTSRNISLNTRGGLLEPPKPIQFKNPPIAPQLTSEYAGQEMVKGKQSKIILARLWVEISSRPLLQEFFKNSDGIIIGIFKEFRLNHLSLMASKFIWNSFVFLEKLCCNLYQRWQSSVPYLHFISVIIFRSEFCHRSRWLWNSSRILIGIPLTKEKKTALTIAP